MKKFSINFVIISIIIILLVVVVNRISEQKSVAEQLKAIGVSFQALDDFILKDIQTKEILDLKITNIEVQKDDTIVHLKLTQQMDKEFASLYLEDKKVGIESLFVEQPAHYPGIITREMNCPDEFQPILGKVGDIEYYIMYANERFSNGVCSMDLVKYRSVVGLGYCEDKDVFVEIKLFYLPGIFTIEDSRKLLDSFSCT